MGELPSVCVIGAGVSGLTACKALADFGVPHTCFEASDEVGGNWYFQNPNGVSSAYRSLHIDISKPSISFRDFPMPDRYPDYPHHTHIFEWLRDYADAFALRERIRFNTRVAARRARARRRLADHARGRQPASASTRCSSATGTTGIRAYPDFPGTFDGPQIHSHDYIDPSTPLDLYGKRVLVVGIGNSAVDIVSELARKTVSDTVFLSTRSGAYVVPKYLFGRPADQVVKTNPRLPAGLQRRIGRLLPRIFSGRMEDFGLPTPNHNFLDAHPTVSSELLGRLGAGDAVAKGDVAGAARRPRALRRRDRGADRRDHLRDRLQRQLPVLRSRTSLSAPENVLPLYKRMLKPGIDDLAFIGLGQPIPTIFPFSELQSKLAARWLSGDWAPPAESEMEAEIRRDEAFHTAHFIDKPRHTMQLEWYAFQRELNTRSIPAGQARARAGAPTGRAVAGRAAAPGSRQSYRHERGLLRQRRRALLGRAPAGRGRDAFADEHGRRPCVVLAHGFGGTVDSGLLPYAERFAAAGLDALAFDYRHFGASDGEPRQLLSIPRQLEDYAAAIAFARSLAGVDPERIVVWGSSYSGGHVVPVAVADGRVAAVIAQVPGMDGLATLLNARALRRPRAALDDSCWRACATSPARCAGARPRWSPSWARRAASAR